MNQVDFVQSALYGLLRGSVVDVLTQPLETIKYHQQRSTDSIKSVHIARSIFAENGVKGFYKGLPPQLMKTGLKQTWTWPMMVEIPNFLKQYEVEKLSRQAITGLSMATVQTAITAPLERAKIIFSLAKPGMCSQKNLLKNGWQGFGIYWMKHSVNYVTFLMTQKYLRDRWRESTNVPLSFPRLAAIGTQVGLIVSIIGAPFDMANTLKQAENISVTDLLSKTRILKFYRGWRVNLVTLIVHNIASTTLLERLGA